MTPKHQTDWQIAVVLKRRPQVLLIEKGALVFDFLGDRFEEIGLGYENGFYDFLRSCAGAITGVRYFPSSDADKALKEISEGEGITRPSDGNLPILQVSWGPDHNFDPEAPCDQYFGNNFIYRAKHSQKFAIGFAIDTLTPQERASLKRLVMA